MMMFSMRKYFCEIFSISRLPSDSSEEIRICSCILVQNRLQIRKPDRKLGRGTSFFQKFVRSSTVCSTKTAQLGPEPYVRVHTLCSQIILKIIVRCIPIEVDA